MVAKKHLSLEERAKIVHSYKALGSIRKVSQSLSVPYSTVRYTVLRFKETNSNMDRPGRGRYEVLSSSDKRFIKLFNKRDRTKNVPVLTEEFNYCRGGGEFSATAIHHCLLNWGLKGRVTAKKPLLRKQNVWLLPKNTSVGRMINGLKYFFPTKVF